jgi:hypothetical protein
MAKDSAGKLAETEDLNINYLDQIEEITHKLSQAETKIKSYESNRLEEGAKVRSFLPYTLHFVYYIQIYTSDSCE